jgi:K+-sensing histidine kinase KdpD
VTAAASTVFGTDMFELHDDAPGDDGGSVAFACLMAGATVGVAAASTPWRHTLGTPNIALVLAAMVGLAGIVGGRLAGGLAGVVAALSFNFFHTQPYHSLRIHSARDVTIVALLAGLGIVVSDISAWRRRKETIAFRHDEATAAPKQLARLLADRLPHDHDPLWDRLIAGRGWMEQALQGSSKETSATLPPPPPPRDT